MTLRIAGGLLGQWSVWTKAAVDLLQRAQAGIRGAGGPFGSPCPGRPAHRRQRRALRCAQRLRRVASPGCHEVLRRQGLLENLVLLNPDEGLGAGQSDEIDRIIAAYPHLTDDAFVAENRERWLQ